MEMKLFIKKFFTVLIIIIAAIIAFAYCTYITFNKHNKNYLASYNIKIKRLEDTRGKRRIILLGGSSGVFSFNSVMVKDSFNMEPVNCALQAESGLKDEIDFFYDFLDKKNDIIIIAAEPVWFYDFDPEFVSEVSLYTKSLRPLSFPSPNVLTYFLQRNNPITYLKELSVSREYTAYHKDNFNAYGDFSHYPTKRKYIMPTFEKKKRMYFTPRLNAGINYLKEKLKGYNYFVVPVIMHSSWDSNDLKEYDAIMELNFGKRYIESAAKLQTLTTDTMFYNTIYHPKLVGKNIYTANLINALKGKIK